MLRGRTRRVRGVMTRTVLWLCGAAAPLGAQWQSSIGPGGAMLGAPVGSDVERYVRALMIAGVIEPTAWGTRALGADAL